MKQFIDTRVIIVIAYGLGFISGQKCSENSKTQEQKSEQSLPSPAAIQRQLNQLEPDNPLKVDGKIGRLTQEKWDRVYIRESAKAAFEEFEERR